MLLERSHQKVTYEASIYNPHLTPTIGQERGNPSEEARGRAQRSQLPNQTRVPNTVIRALDVKRQHKSTFLGLDSSAIRRKKIRKCLLGAMSYLESKLFEINEATRLKVEPRIPLVCRIPLVPHAHGCISMRVLLP